MVEDVLNRLSKFQLKGKEYEGIVLDLNDISKRKEEYEGTLLGQIWGLKKQTLLG